MQMENMADAYMQYNYQQMHGIIPLEEEETDSKIQKVCIIDLFGKPPYVFTAYKS